MTNSKEPLTAALYKFYGITGPNGETHHRLAISQATWDKEHEAKMIKFFEILTGYKKQEAKWTLENVVSKFRDDYNATYCRTKLEKLIG